MEINFRTESTTAPRLTADEIYAQQRALMATFRFMAGPVAWERHRRAVERGRIQARATALSVGARLA